jgi:hypothetical protein
MAPEIRAAGFFEHVQEVVRVLKVCAKLSTLLKQKCENKSRIAATCRMLSDMESISLESILEAYKHTFLESRVRYPRLAKVIAADIISQFSDR